MEVKQRLTIFDFDGTLTTRDTLLEFIRFACGRWAFVWGFLLHSPLLVLMKMHLYHNGKAKERLFSYYFRGWAEERFNQICQKFADSHRHLLRPSTVAILRQAQKDGSRVFIVTASIDRWVQPFFPDLEVIGTKIAVQENLLTGLFLTPNCYGQEKINRISQVIESRSDFYVTAYGDSRGDRELLAWADEGILVKSKIENQ